MVERPADVLPMDRTVSPRIDWFLRLDRACRRIPGLGVLLCLAIAQVLWAMGLYILLVFFAVAAGKVVLDEFLPKR